MLQLQAKYRNKKGKVLTQSGRPGHSLEKYSLKKKFTFKLTKKKAIQTSG